ncbi:MAG: dirigent protein [Gaiellaceae bacterium]|jgi:hypothetical protein
MTVTAPPRPPRPSDPVDREEIEALVEALIEEARQRARRRRRRYAASALLALLVALVAYVGFARGGGEAVKSADIAGLPAQGPRQASASSMTFRLISTPTSSRVVDRAPKGVLNTGDVMYVKSVLRNWKAQFGRPEGAVVGSDSWVYTTLATPGLSLATATVKLPGGTLRLRGRIHSSHFGRVVPVVGGTGRFENARGTNKFRNRLDGKALDDYTLRLP